MVSKYPSIFQVTLADVITFLNVSLGFSSIVASALGQWGAAFVMLIGAMVMDYLDGTVARALDKISDLGTNLDSLSDIVSFGAAPAFWLLSKNSFHPLLLTASLVFLSCGAFRLGRYNILHKVVKKGWIGMPITANALILPIAGFLTSNILILVIVVLASSIAMVSRVKMKRFF